MKDEGERRRGRKTIRRERKRKQFLSYLDFLAGLITILIQENSQ